MRGAKAINLTGKKFTRWTVVGRAGSTTRGQPLWLCECACGKTAVVQGKSLRHRTSRSCGCLKVDMTRTYLRRVYARVGQVPFSEGPWEGFD